MNLLKRIESVNSMLVEENGQYRVIDKTTGLPVSTRRIDIKGVVYHDNRIVQQACSEVVRLLIAADCRYLTSADFKLAYEALYRCLKKQIMKMSSIISTSPYFRRKDVDYDAFINRDDISSKVSLDILVPWLHSIHIDCMSKNSSSPFYSKWVDVDAFRRKMLLFMSPFTLYMNGTDARIHRTMTPYWLYTTGGVQYEVPECYRSEHMYGLILMPAYINYILDEKPILPTNSLAYHVIRTKRTKNYDITSIDNEDLSRRKLTPYEPIYMEGCVRYGLPIKPTGRKPKNWFRICQGDGTSA